MHCQVNRKTTKVISGRFFCVLQKYRHFTGKNLPETNFGLY